MEHADLIVTALVATLVLSLLIAAVVLLLVVSTNRRHRHRAQLAELHLAHGNAVMQAEREATQLTLQEVGRELHDNVGQLLSFADMGLSTVLEERPHDPHVEAAREALEQGIEELRRLGHTLNTDMWRDRSLPDAISAEAERLERVGRMRAYVVLHGAPPLLSADVKTILFRVFQEIIHNAVKHSGADTITISLTSLPRTSLTITDNGIGFDTRCTETNAGIANIHARCALIGFEANCISAPSQGCTWHIRSLNDHGT